MKCPSSNRKLKPQNGFTGVDCFLMPHTLEVSPSITEKGQEKL